MKGKAIGLRGKIPLLMKEVSLALIQNEKGHILLVREKGKKEWGFVGGKKEMFDKNHRVTKKREVLEELGSEFADKLERTYEFMDFITPTRNHPEGVHFRVFRSKFNKNIFSPISLGITIDKVAFFSIYTTAPLLPGARIVIKKLQKDKDALKVSAS